MASPPSEALLPWALAKLGAGPAAAPELRPVAGDASHRRYFRFHSGGRNYVLAEAPPALEKNPEFVTVQGLLDSAGVRVPALFAVDLERGFLLQEDLGDQMLLPLLEADSVDEYYARAFDLLRRMAVLDTASCPLPAYDATLLGEELDRFEAWFLRELLGRSVKAAEREMLRAVSGLLIASALEQPRVLVHRDFHSRNLMLDPGGELAVIDFQDAVVGPVTYDLVSLLRDCYIRWPREQVRDWALAYRQQLVSAGLPAGADEGQFLRWFDWMGLQRHIKVLGTFARLYLRDGKAAYLDDLPLVFAYVREVLGDYRRTEPVLADFDHWLGECIVPLVAEQTWSSTG